MDELLKRLEAISKELEVFAGLDSMTESQVVDANVLSAEFESISGQIEAKKKVAELIAKSGASTRQTTPVAVSPRIEVAASRTEKMGGFKSGGEFFAAVKNASRGNVDKRFQNTMFERTGEEGGYLVPEEIMSDIQKKVMISDESLFAKVTKFNVSGNSLSYPVDEKNPWNNGVTAYWVAEGAPITQSRPILNGRVSHKLEKLGAIVPVSDELLEDAIALESYINNAAPSAIMHKLNDAILRGNGVGKPLGILNSGFKYKVAKEGGQAADTIVARNVIKMYSRLIPSSLGRAAWYVNAGVVEQLRLMKDDNDNFIYLAAGSQLNNGPYATLMGLPVIPMIGGLRELGTESDILLADFSYFHAIVKTQGIKQDISTHLYFDQALVAYRFIMRVDGRCPFSSPVTTEFGDYQMSGFVTLEDR
jgi:HK97 family phage major capsid protein